MTAPAAPVAILMVCMGNICRSPVAEGITRHLATQRGWQPHLVLDSAGTHGDYHPDSPPDPRSQASLLARGIDISGLRARPVVPADFTRFDYLLAMDHANLAHLQAMAPRAALQKIQLLLDYAPQQPARAVPDPYYGEAAGFARVVELVELGAAGLLATLAARYGWD